MPKCILTNQNSKNSSNFMLMGIEITQLPNKINYIEGETFDPTGMIVTASYGTGITVLATQIIKSYICVPSIISNDTQNILIKYSEGGKFYTTKLNIGITLKPTSLTISALPQKTIYSYLDDFDPNGMIITANYPDGSTSQVIDYSFSPKTFNDIGKQNVAINYFDKTVNLQVIVNKLKLKIPNQITELTYNGNPQTVIYWNNYNPNCMSIDGILTATNAGNYSVFFNLTQKDKCLWEDETIEEKEVNWTINKKKSNFILNEAVVNLSSLQNFIVNFEAEGDGNIEVEETNDAFLFRVLDSKIFFTPSTEIKDFGTYTIKIYLKEGQNYLQSAIQTLTININLWSWDSEDEIGDAAWWAGLKNWAANATASERAACVGKKKLVSLSTTVLGANAATMICIGADQDGTGTLTFQTAGALPTYTAFGSNAVWIGSTARTQCQNFYNYCSAKESIKIVSKGTCPNRVYDRNGIATYNDETVWIPSETEMGLDFLSSLAKSNSTISNSECTQGYNAGYNYYTSNATRVKYQMNANGILTTSTVEYWERSSYAFQSDRVCYIDSSGGIYDSLYYDTCSLAPAFVIG